MDKINKRKYISAGDPRNKNILLHSMHEPKRSHTTGPGLVLKL